MFVLALMYRTLLTRLMAKAMNRSISSVLFSSFGASGEAAPLRTKPRCYATQAVGCQEPRTRDRLRAESCVA